jgi:hypothetical protein
MGRSVCRNYKGKLAEDYEYDCYALAHRTRLGKDALVQRNLKLWALDIYHITTEAMWEDALRTLALSYPSDINRLTDLERQKARGVKELYSFELGEHKGKRPGWLLIDQAISAQKAILSHYPESIRGKA